MWLAMANIASQVGETQEFRGVLEILLLCSVCAVSNPALYIYICIYHICMPIYVYIPTYVHIYETVSYTGGKVI